MNFLKINNQVIISYKILLVSVYTSFNVINTKNIEPLLNVCLFQYLHRMHSTAKQFLKLFK